MMGFIIILNSLAVLGIWYSLRDEYKFPKLYYLLLLIMTALIVYNVEGLDIVHFVVVSLIPPAIKYFKLKAEIRDIEKGMIGFLNAVNLRLTVDSNIITALEKSLPAISSKHIKKHIGIFCKTMKLSGNKFQAFSQIAKVPHSYFGYVFMNIEHVVDSWGDARELMKELEQEYISVQIEISKGRVELENDKTLTIIGLVIASLTGLNIIASDSRMLDYYIKRPTMVVFILGLALAGAVLLWKTRAQS